MRVNTKVKPSPVYTHEGAIASRITPAQQLRRSVMACLLWESSFYEDGQSVVERIASLVPQVEPAQVAAMAIEARERMNLRHAPLLLVREMARHPKHKALVGETLARIIQRADELGEFVALYWKDGKQPLARQVKDGLRAAFGKFDEYQLAKYNRDAAVTLRDVLRLVHPRPADEAQAALWKRLIVGGLATPDTWEVSLSANDGQTKQQKWERLLSENRLGALALLRNMRNFEQEGVDHGLIRQALQSANVRRVLPFRFIAAARHAPRWEPELEAKLFESVAESPKLPGVTKILVDVSASMDVPLSAKSDMTRMDAACGVAMVAREMCEYAEVFSFSNTTVSVPPRRGFALRDAIVNSQHHGSTQLGAAINELSQMRGRTDRLIVVTDEQTHDRVPDPFVRPAYMLNVASYENGVGYGAWTHIDGFSESVLRYISEAETANDA